MKLGDHQTAPDDCAESPRYGNLPNAFQKQQELVKLLKQRQQPHTP